MKSHPGVAADMFDALAEAGINIEIISTSSIRVSCVVRSAEVERAVRAVHARFRTYRRGAAQCLSGDRRRRRDRCSRVGDPRLLEERGYDDVRVFASARSAGTRSAGYTVEEATPEALARGDVDLFLFSVGGSASRELVPHAVRGGAVAIDKSATYRLQPGFRSSSPEVNAERAPNTKGSSPIRTAARSR